MSDQRETRRVFLGMPGYGQLTGGAAFGLFNAVRGPVDIGGAAVDLHVERTFSEGSLLAHNFNDLWCIALNLNANGTPVDYFAMLHADVEPESDWLGALIEELERTGSDIVGAVVPIKNGKGLTSVALQNPLGDAWRPLCRLSLAEVAELPTTFSTDDVGYDLLLNTGCWVCKFDPAWIASVCFTINDRITFDEAKGMYRAEAEPEDWNFSRQLHTLGLKVSATTRVRLNHAGQQRFPNDGAWGTQAFDAEYLEASAIR